MDNPLDLLEITVYSLKTFNFISYLVHFPLITCFQTFSPPKINSSPIKSPNVADIPQIANFKTSPTDRIRNSLNIIDSQDISPTIIDLPSLSKYLT